MHPQLEIDRVTGSPKCCNCKHWLGVAKQAKGQCTKHKMDTLDLARCTGWDEAEDVEIKVKRDARPEA